MANSDETSRSVLSQTTVENPAYTLANIKTRLETLEKPGVEDHSHELPHTRSKGFAESGSVVIEIAPSLIEKIEGTIGGIRINVRIFREPTPRPAGPEEVVQKKTAC